MTIQALLTAAVQNLKRLDRHKPFHGARAIAQVCAGVSAPQPLGHTRLHADLGNSPTSYTTQSLEQLDVTTLRVITLPYIHNLGVGLIEECKRVIEKIL